MAKPLIRRVARRLVRALQGGSHIPAAAAADYIKFEGDYSCWQEAVDCSTGYAAEDIAAKVLQTTLQVLNGRFAFERDSVVFVLPEYNWPLLSCLLGAAAVHDGHLRVLDFGGALGSVFLQHRQWFGKLPRVDWRVVEQDGCVRLGCEHIMPSMA
ncbi:MAG: methyltransferase, TIGR04325 family, partial [Planctomycetaceae bacterium]